MNSTDCGEPPGRCLVAGTPVHTKDGLRAIERLGVGDLVLDRPQHGGQARCKRVAKTFHFEARIVHAVFYAAGEGMDPVGTVFATGLHLFWVEGKGWTRADALDLEKQLLLEPARGESNRPVARRTTGAERSVGTGGLASGEALPSADDSSRTPSRSMTTAIKQVQRGSPP